MTTNQDADLIRELNDAVPYLMGLGLPASAAWVQKAAARLSELTQPAPQRTDGMPTSRDERHLRRMLALRVGIPGLYGDDGEASGAQHGIQFDFMRDSVDDLQAKLTYLNTARWKAGEQAEQPAPLALLPEDAEQWKQFLKGLTQLPAPLGDNPVINAILAVDALLKRRVQRLTEEQAAKFFDGMKADPRTANFSQFNWLVAGVTFAEAAHFGEEAK